MQKHRAGTSVGGIVGVALHEKVEAVARLLIDRRQSGAQKYVFGFYRVGDKRHAHAAAIDAGQAVGERDVRPTAYQLERPNARRAWSGRALQVEADPDLAICQIV